MRLLLDTHILLWFLFADPRLGPRARALIEDSDATVAVSMVSFWEIALKSRIGKLSIDLARVFDDVRRGGFAIPGLHEAHLHALRQLPLTAGHRDPFDHVLIAQTLAEDLTLLSAGAWVTSYPVRHLAAA